MMNRHLSSTLSISSAVIILLLILSSGCQRFVVIDETYKAEYVEKTIPIDSVWAGHPVGFSLYTHDTRQYIAYYNSNRNMVVGQRDLADDVFELHMMPATSRENCWGHKHCAGLGQSQLPDHWH